MVTGAFVSLSLAVFVALFLPRSSCSAPLSLQYPVLLDASEHDDGYHAVPAPKPTAPRPPTPRSVLDELGEDDEYDKHGDSGQQPKKLPSLPSFVGTNLTREFTAYDLDRSRGVSLAELSAVTDTKMEDALGPFRAADTDGNNVLSQREFTQAPWIFDASGITLDPADEGHPLSL